MSWIGFSFFCMVLTTAKTVMAKYLLNRHDSQMFLFADLAFPTLLLLPFMRYEELSQITADLMVMVSLIALPAVFSLSCLSKATQKGQISEIAPLLTLIPAASAATAVFWGIDEPLSLTGWIGILTVVMGGYMLKVESLNDLAAPLKSLVKEQAFRYLAVTIIISVMTVNLQKTLVMAYSAKIYLFCHFMVLTTLAWPIALRAARRENITLRSFTYENITAYTLLGLISLGSAFSLMSALALNGPIGYVLSIKRLSVVFIAMIGMIFMQESYRRPKAIGVLMMVSGGFILYQY